MLIQFHDIGGSKGEGSPLGQKKLVDYIRYHCAMTEPGPQLLRISGSTSERQNNVCKYIIGIKCQCHPIYVGVRNINVSMFCEIHTFVMWK